MLLHVGDLYFAELSEPSQGSIASPFYSLTIPVPPRGYQAKLAARVNAHPRFLYLRPTQNVLLNPRLLLSADKAATVTSAVEPARHNTRRPRIQNL